MTTHIANEQLSRLRDVLLSALVSGQALVWDSAQKKWINGEAVTSEQIQDIIGNILTDSTTINFNYDDTLNQITADVQNLVSTDIGNFNEAVDDRVATLLVAGTNIILTYDDVSNTLTIAGIPPPDFIIKSMGVL